MIIFGNLYQKNLLPRFNIIAIYRNGKLDELDIEEKNELFPNAGNVFVPPNTFIPSNVKYGLYKVYESPTYEPDKQTSLKYALGPEVRDIPLYEVIQIHEKIDDEHLYQRFQDGFRFSYEPLANVLFLTEDNFLIGPLQLRKRNNHDIWEVSDANFASYYPNNLEFLSYENKYVNEPKRFFVVFDFDQQMKVGEVDIATNERAIRDILKRIRENVEFGEISRRVMQQLSEWGNTNYFSKEYLQKRLKRVMHILKTHTLDDSLMEEVQKNVFHLPYIQNYINEQLNSYQNAYRKKFEDEHRDLLNQIKKLQTERELLTSELEAKQQDKDRLEKFIKQLKKKSEEKIAEIQANVLDVFVNQLMMRGLAFFETSSALSNIAISTQSESPLFFMSLSLNAPTYSDLEDLWKKLNQQVRIPEYQLLGQTIVCAIASGSPIAITGKSSLEFANLIAQITSANEAIIVLPEVHTFSLNRLVETFTQYESEHAVKALILHNVHLTTAESSILPFLKLMRLSSESKYQFPNLIILSFDETETSADFMKKLQMIPILNADLLLNKSTSRKINKSDENGQLLLSVIEKMNVERDKDVREAFEDWLLNKKNLELHPWPKQLDDWIFYLKVSDVNQVELFEWVWHLFGHCLQPDYKRSE